MTCKHTEVTKTTTVFIARVSVVFLKFMERLLLTLVLSLQSYEIALSRLKSPYVALCSVKSPTVALNCLKSQYFN